MHGGETRSDLIHKSLPSACNQLCCIWFALESTHVAKLFVPLTSTRSHTQTRTPKHTHTHAHTHTHTHTPAPTRTNTSTLTQK